jgi:hypothetical protein
VLVGVGGCLGELLGESLVVGPGCVEVGFGSFGADAEGGAGFFEGSEAGVRGSVQLVTLALGVGADAGDFFGGLGLGVVGALDSGGFGLLGACGFLLGPVELAGRVGHQAARFLAGLLDVALCGGAGLLQFGRGGSAELADLLGGGGAQGGEFVHAGDGLGGCLVGLLAVGVGVVPVGFGVAAALDFFGKPCFGGGYALVGVGAGDVYLGFGRFHVPSRAQLGDGAGEGVGVLGGELLQGADKLGSSGQAESDGLAAGLVGRLPAGLGLEAAALTVGGEWVVAVVGAVFRLGAAVAGRCCGGLVAAWVDARGSGG